MSFPISEASEQEITVTENTDQSFWDLPDPTEQKILDFSTLSRGWHFGNGMPPSKSAIETALSINSFAQSLSLRTDAFPGIDGELQIRCYNETDTIEITIEADNTITYALDRAGEEMLYLERLSFQDVIKQLCEHGQVRCDLFESSTPDITTDIGNSSSVWRLEIPLMEAAYRLFPFPA